MYPGKELIEHFIMIENGRIPIGDRIVPFKIIGESIDSNAFCWAHSIVEKRKADTNSTAGTKKFFT
ncbi:MAG: hypothetical protein ABIN25_13825 [Ginsengibacter sp.]